MSRSMSRLPHRKSRPITVDGHTYRWLLKGHNKYIGRSPGVVSISIQEDIDHPGQTLSCVAVSNQAEEAQEEMGDCTTAIYPSDIEKLIRIGLEKGWTPNKGSGSFDLENVALKEYYT